MRINGMKLYRLEWYDSDSVCSIIFTNRKAALSRYSDMKCDCDGCRIIEMYKAFDDTMRDGYVIEEYLKTEYK